MMFEGYSSSKDIVMISVVEFFSPTWTNKQHIASRLAKAGFQVVYVQPQKRILTGNPRTIVRSEQDSLRIVETGWGVPFPHRLRLSAKTSAYLLASSVLHIMNQENINRPILWIYAPHSFALPDLIPHCLTLYDCVDDYATFPGAWHSKIRSMEHDLVKKVDLVTCTSDGLYQRLSKVNPNCHIVGNAADIEAFNKRSEPLSELALLPKPVVGYLGAINFKIDADLVAETAAMAPDMTFAFIGPIKMRVPSSWKACRNIRLLGLKPFSLLPAVTSGFDAAWIPYRIGPHTENVFPLKTYEYLASGLAVVSTPLPELKNLVLTARTGVEFIRILREEIESDSEEKREKRRRTADGHSYENRIAKILDLIQATLQKKKDF